MVRLADSHAKFDSDLILNKTGLWRVWACMHALLALRGKLMLAYFGPNVLRFSVKQIFPLWGKLMKLAEIDQSGSIGQSSPGGTGIKVVSFRDMHSEISLKVSPINMWTSISAHLGPIFLSFICSSLNSFKILEHTKFMMILMLLKWMTKIHFLSKQTVFSLTLNQSYFRFHISNTDHIIDVVQGRLVKTFLTSICWTAHLHCSSATSINIICPHFHESQKTNKEEHIIYSVGGSSVSKSFSLSVSSAQS